MITLRIVVFLEKFKMSSGKLRKRRKYISLGNLNIVEIFAYTVFRR